ncbi:MAG: hypothetical protein ACRC5C_07705, partial [Bacilli bacterium]
MKERLPFDQWMDKQLYDPDTGYYASKREKVGKNGDFLTSPTMSGVFCEVIARTIHARILKRGLPHHIVEFGGGTLRLYSEIARYWAVHFPTERLVYDVIDVSVY